MNKSLLVLAAIAAFGLASVTTRPAKAGGFGLHFAGPGYHFDIGPAHHYNTFYGGDCWGLGSSHQWHNTSHYDYHPGEWIPYGNDFDYQPGHYDFHRSGHWDHLHW